MNHNLYKTIVVVCVLTTLRYAQSETQYMVVNIEGEKSGYAYSQRVVDGEFVKTTEFMKLTVNRFGFMMEVTEKTTFTETVEGEPLHFVSEQKFSDAAPKITRGRVRGNTIRISRGEQGEEVFDYPPDTLMPEGVRLLITEEGIAEGKKFEVSIFDSGLLRSLPTKIEILEKENLDIYGRIKPLYKAVTATTIPGIGEIKLTSYVDEDYKPFQSTTILMGMRIEMLACDELVAKSPISPSDIFSNLLIKSPATISTEALENTIIYTLQILNDDAEFNIPSNYNQEVRKEGNQVVVIVSPFENLEGQKLPVDYSDKPEISKYLEANSYVQSDNEKIIELAKKAIGTATDTLIAARNIEQFVHEYIHGKDLSVGYATALEVLNSRQGDCTEHAVLTAALCRANKIPAKVVCGVVYAESFAGAGDIFGGHAWVEAHIGDAWLPLDATIGKNGFGSGHIKLAEGDGNPEQFFSLIKILGNFEITDIKILQVAE